MPDNPKDLISNSRLQKTLYFQSDNGCSLMVMKNKKQEVLAVPLVKIERMLPPGLFCRVHRNYLVNINAVSEFRHYRDQYFAFASGYRIPVSRRMKKILMDNLDIL